MNLFKIIRENERLKAENSFLKKENERLAFYQKDMQRQWQNWWSFDGKMQEADDGED